MNTKIDVHENNNYKIKLNAVSLWKVPESTKKEIKTFIEKAQLGQVKEGKKISEKTLSKYLSVLRHVLEVVNKPTSSLTKGDMEKIDKHLTNKKLKSAGDFKLILQTFLKWKLGESKQRKISSWFDVKRKMKTPDYLTESEILKLFKSCKSASERYLIAVLFDTGARAEEFLNIRFEDIQMPEKNINYVKITLKEEYSKTAGRNISLYWKHSLEAVRDYLKEREQDNIKQNEQVFNKNYDAIRMFLFRLGKKVLNKEIYPHLFRHTSATYYATKLNRQELCYRYGWKFSSNMPDVYISRAGMESKELDEKFKSTELEDLNNKFEKDKLDKDITIKDLQQQINIIVSSPHYFDENLREAGLPVPPSPKEFEELVKQHRRKNG